MPHTTDLVGALFGAAVRSICGATTPVPLDRAEARGRAYRLVRLADQADERMNWQAVGGEALSVARAFDADQWNPEPTDRPDGPDRLSGALDLDDDVMTREALLSLATACALSLSGAYLEERLGLRR